MYTSYFTVTGIIAVVLINDADPDYDIGTFITILVMSTLIFLLPRFIGLCVSRNVVPRRPALLVVNR